MNRNKNVPTNEMLRMWKSFSLRTDATEAKKKRRKKMKWNLYDDKRAQTHSLIRGVARCDEHTHTHTYPTQAVIDF